LRLKPWPKGGVADDMEPTAAMILAVVPVLWCAAASLLLAKMGHGWHRSAIGVIPLLIVVLGHLHNERHRRRRLS
jgi:hypothetical protein